MKVYGNLKDAVQGSIHMLCQMGNEVHPNNWQSMSVVDKPEALMKELLFWGFKCPIPNTYEELDRLVEPNQPWTEKHFQEERVSREPINPGETWRIWPWGNSASQFINEGQYDHSYAERYWPRFAGYTSDGHISSRDKALFFDRTGVRNRVGDLDDLIDRMVKDPLTRQCVLSVWHPEDQVDTGKRVPCSLTYQFIMRDGFLHMIYNIRSCDALRHFRDDVFLTCRLTQWFLNELRKKDSSWNNVNTGMIAMTIGSFHCFINDLPLLAQQV